MLEGTKRMSAEWSKSRRHQSMDPNHSLVQSVTLVCLFDDSASVVTSLPYWTGWEEVLLHQQEGVQHWQLVLRSQTTWLHETSTSTSYALWPCPTSANISTSKRPHFELVPMALQ